MGLLDGMPTSLADVQRSSMATAGLLARLFERHPDLPPRFEAACKAMVEGQTPAMVIGLDRKEIDALLALGGKYLQVGQIEQSKEWLSLVCTLDPLEQRALYLLGVACQTSGEYGLAAQMYIRFLALDATNPEGYLRLGECFLANAEPDQARGCFEMAGHLCGKGHGTDKAREHAERMLAALPAQSK